MDFSLNDIITGLVGLGLVAKGILDRKGRPPAPLATSCAMADVKATQIFDQLKVLAEACKETKEEREFMRSALTEILTILRERKH